MDINKKLPQRKSPRANFHDYSGGNYFITICTKDKKHYFGKIIDGAMQLSKVGEYCKFELENLHEHIIRDLHDQNLIAEYIENNVVRWSTDCFLK